MPGKKPPLCDGNEEAAGAMPRKWPEAPGECDPYPGEPVGVRAPLVPLPLAAPKGCGLDGGEGMKYTAAAAEEAARESPDEAAKEEGSEAECAEGSAPTGRLKATGVGATIEAGPVNGTVAVCD